MTHDGHFFPNPDAFQPDRYLEPTRARDGRDRNEKGRQDQDKGSEWHGADDPSGLIFGFGRR